MVWDKNNAADASYDGDSDLLTNLQEYQNGTDPGIYDTDADGLSDGDEVLTHGTHPNNLDTDSDGISDGQEITNGTNPLDANDPAPETVVTVPVRIVIDTAIDNGNLFPGLVPGSELLGEFSYDTLSPDLNPGDPTNASYENSVQFLTCRFWCRNHRIFFQC